MAQPEPPIRHAPTARPSLPAPVAPTGGLPSPVPTACFAPAPVLFSAHPTPGLCTAAHAEGGRSAGRQRPLCRTSSSPTTPSRPRAAASGAPASPPPSLPPPTLCACLTDLAPPDAPLGCAAACAPARPASSGSTTSSCAASASGSRPTSSVSARCAHAPDCARDARGWECGRVPDGAACRFGLRGGARRHSPRRGAAASRGKRAGGGRALGRQGVGAAGGKSWPIRMLSLRPLVSVPVMLVRGRRGVRLGTMRRAVRACGAAVWWPDPVSIAT